MEETAITLNPHDDSSAAYLADGMAQTTVSNQAATIERVGGLLVTNDGFYIADINGTRILLGGIPLPDGVDTAGVWVPDTDMV